MSEIIVTQIELQTVEGEIRVDHRIVAEGLGFVNTATKNSATQWRRNILEKYQVKLERLGVLFKTTLDDGSVVWYLNEAQANFAGTLSKNTEQAVEFKLQLVQSFQAAKEALRSLNQQQQVVEACILLQPTPWQCRFERDYYDHLSRLTGLQPEGHKRPALWGALTKELVYDYLPEGVTEALLECRKQHGKWEKLHQYLSDVGLKVFENHMRSLQCFMLAASSLDDLRRLLKQSVTRSYQLLLF